MDKRKIYLTVIAAVFILTMFLSKTVFSQDKQCSEKENIEGGTDNLFEISDTYLKEELHIGYIKDIDGNKYKIVKIGNQMWMAENLKTTTYNNGRSIRLEEDSATWVGLTTAAYCWFNNDEITYKDTYGALYNWYTVNTRVLCPTGWHVPSDDEWTILANYLGGHSVAGGKLKEAGTTHWVSPNSGATNEAKFYGLPGAARDFDGTFLEWIGYYGVWWSNTISMNNPIRIWGRGMKFNGAELQRWGNGRVNEGLSVRCIKDE